MNDKELIKSDNDSKAVNASHYSLSFKIGNIISAILLGMNAFTWIQLLAGRPQRESPTAKVLCLMLLFTAVIWFLGISLVTKAKSLLLTSKMVSRLLIFGFLFTSLICFILESIFNMSVPGWLPGFPILTLIFVFYYCMIRSKIRYLDTAGQPSASPKVEDPDNHNYYLAMKRLFRK